MTHFREAEASDAEMMTEVQNAIHRAGLRESPVDIAFVKQRYLESAHVLACTVAVDDDGSVRGFQSLSRAWPGNPYDVEVGWGVIGTHIHPGAHRAGLGRRLFAETLRAARTAGLQHIDATIGEHSAPALAYYAALGFAPYRSLPGAVAHRFDLTGGDSADIREG